MFPRRWCGSAAGSAWGLSGLAESYSTHLSDKAFMFGPELLIAGLRADIASSKAVA
jgi:hypothetical protein